MSHQGEFLSYTNLEQQTVYGEQQDLVIRNLPQPEAFYLQSIEETPHEVLNSLILLHNDLPFDERTFDEVMETSITFMGPTASNLGDFDANFARDAQRMSNDAIEILNFILAEHTLWGAVHTRGLRFEPQTDQEPDKIIHEHRSILLVQSVTPEIQKIFEDLRKWSNAKPKEPVESISYYGGEDQTPQHVILANNYEKKHTDPEHAKRFLDTFVPHIEEFNNQVTIRESAYGALGRITRKMRDYEAMVLDTHGKLPFYAFKRAEKTGIPFPIWTDSNFAAFHKDGTSVNIDDWVVHTQLQALTLSSLMAGAELKRREASHLPEFDRNKAQIIADAESWETLAKKLHTAIEKNLWNNEENYPLFGLDRDENGNTRPIEMQTSIGTEMLNTAYFDPVFWEGREEKRLYQMKGILDKASSPEDFLTEGGPSVVSLKYKPLIHDLGYSPYHMDVQWDKNVKEGVIDGCRSKDLPLTALAFSYLLRRSRAIYVGLHGNKHFPEFSYAHPEKLGKKIYNLIVKPENSEIEGLTLKGTNIPVEEQNWTASAIIGEETYIQNNIKAPTYSSKELQTLDVTTARKVLAYIVTLPSVAETIRYEEANPVYLDIQGGKRAEILMLIAHGRESMMIENSIKEGLVTEEEVREARLARERRYAT